MLKKRVLLSLSLWLVVFSCVQPEAPDSPQPPSGPTGKILLYITIPSKDRSFSTGYDGYKIVAFNDSFLKEVTLESSTMQPGPNPVEFVVPIGKYTIEAGAWIYTSSHQPYRFGFNQYGYSENVTVEAGKSTNVKIAGFIPQVSLIIQDLNGNNLIELTGGQTIRVKADRGNMPAFTAVSSVSLFLFIDPFLSMSENYLFDNVPISFDSFTTLTVPQITATRTYQSVVMTSFTHFSNWSNYSHQPTLQVSPPAGTIIIELE